MTQQPGPVPAGTPAPVAPGAPATGESGRLWKYLAIFVGMSILLSAIFAVIDSVIGGSVSGVSALVPFFAAATAVDAFVKRHLRVLTPAEKWWLIWWSFGITVAWAVVVGGTVLAASGYAGQIWDEMGVWLPILLVIGAAVSFLAIWAGYAWWPRRSLRNRTRYLERQAAKRR